MNNTLHLSPMAFMFLREDRAREIIDATGGRIFFVEFVKKDGSIRKMTARKGVHKGVTGKGMTWDPEAHGYATVYDMDKDAWRLVNCRSILRIHCAGHQYNVLTVGG